MSSSMSVRKRKKRVGKERSQRRREGMWELTGFYWLEQVRSSDSSFLDPWEKLQRWWQSGGRQSRHSRHWSTTSTHLWANFLSTTLGAPVDFFTLWMLLRNTNCQDWGWLPKKGFQIAISFENVTIREVFKNASHWKIPLRGYPPGLNRRDFPKKLAEISLRKKGVPPLTEGGLPKS